MRVFSIQNQDFVNSLLKNKEISGCKDKITEVWPEFISPYLWMISQMKKRGINQNETFPIWVWNKKPDKRLYMFNYLKKEEHKIIELEIPSDQILFSSFRLWNFVLNDFPINIHNNPDAPLSYVSSLSEAEKESESKNWEYIFEKESYKEDKYVQGCVHQIKSSQVIKIY